MKVAFKEKSFPSATGNCRIRYCMWIPEEVRAAVQLTHGMAEHIDRYASFARFLAENGILVYGQDHAGHGKSVGEDMPKGFFCRENGWDALIQDMRTLYDTVKKDYPSIPFILFGHSMGSFLARTYAGRDGKDFDAYVFSGTAGGNPALPVAKFIARREIRKNGAEVPSDLLNTLAFGTYNKTFEKRTNFDWLSANRENVDKYVADEFCGFPFTASAMLDLFTGLSEISSKKWAANVPDRPILLVAGDRDPVGNMGKGVRQVEKWLKQTGHESTETVLYPGMRHEILNETDGNRVAGDILLFIETVAASGEKA